ncbi:MAG: hypothetical protein JSV44_09650 [Candidatus Zixiibacteriota bacterium]|nr:MAG: hypothetical protein JSV44_09650 [candidate division Zixibacteria bacterium]
MRCKAVFPAALAALLITNSGYADKFIDEQLVFPKDDIDLLSVCIDFAAGDIRIGVHETDHIAVIDVEYNARTTKVAAEYENDDRIGYLDLSSKQRRKSEINTEDNLWDVTLSTRYVAEFDLDLGACQADLDLGGIPTEMFNLDIGAAKGTLTFSKPNPISAEKINIDAGAASFDLEQLGNANFSRFEFGGGLGKFVLDFSGKYTAKSRAKISIGMGKAVIHIPASLPVRIETNDNFLSSVDFKNADHQSLDGDYYETEDFHSSDYGLDVSIDVGMGSIEIIFDE